MSISDAAERHHESPLPYFAHPDGAPRLVVLDNDLDRLRQRAQALESVGAHLLAMTDAGGLEHALARHVVDAVVVCADDPTTCCHRVRAARAHIARSGRVVPLIAWQAVPDGPCSERASMLQQGADTILNAPSSVSELLSACFALRRLIRTAHQVD